MMIIGYDRDDFKTPPIHDDFVYLYTNRLKETEPMTMKTNTGCGLPDILWSLGGLYSPIKSKFVQL